MTGELVVVPYDDAWPRLFETLTGPMRDALRDVPVVAIEHVGSTAVPGLVAKPVIDIDIVVREAHLPAAVEALKSLGYEHRGDLGVPLREAFRAPAGLPRHHTYVTVEGCLSLRNHLAVRDLLRRDAELRDEYGAVKLALAAATDGVEVYVDGKTDVVAKILRRAGIAADEVSEIETRNRLPVTPP